MQLKTITTILLILFMPLILLAQSSEKWTKIVSPKNDLTVLIPGDFLVDNEDGEYHIYAYLNEVRINLSVQNDGQAKSRLKMMRQFPYPTEAQVTQFTLDDFIGDTYVFGNKKDSKNTFSMSMYFASSKAFYILSISSKIKNNPTLEKFLYSVRLNKTPLIKQENSINQDTEKGVSLASLETSLIILEALRKKDSEKPKVIYISEDEQEKKTEETKYSRPLTILRKPQAKYTDSGRQNSTQGKIRLKIIFKADGQIGDIIVLQKLSNGLTKEAINAARKIKFLPAEIDGKAVDSTKIVEYQFTIY